MTLKKLLTVLCVAILLAIAASAGGWIVAINDVQNSRRKVTLENCEGQNNRNKNTIVELVSHVEGLPPNQKAAAELTTPFIITLIDSLSPYRDCREVLKKAGL